MNSTDRNPSHPKPNYSKTQLLLDSLRAPIESYLLLDAVKVYPNERVLDIGSGNGIMAISLAVKYPTCHSVSGIDIVLHHFQQAIAVQNKIKSEPAHCMAETNYCNGDIRKPPFFKSSFDVIVSNPPFYVSGSGRSSPNPYKKIAHEECTLSIHELFEAVSYLLTPRGRFYMVYPIARIDDVFLSGKEYNLVLSDKIDFPEVRKRSGGVAVMNYIFNHKGVT